MGSSCMKGFSVLGVAVLASAAVWWTYPGQANAHCQVPCGIYDDAARIGRLKEDASTIAKAIKNINDLVGSRDAKGLNQVTRWVVTKEDHAEHIITVVAEYFLCQRVKPVAEGSSDYQEYLQKLADHHAVMVAAMKTKQAADPASASMLSKAIDRLASHY